jgi:hypothetical protein
VLSDNSSTVATTSFVKGQNYATTSSLAAYAQMTAAQTWSAVQTFNSGILSSAYDALNAASTLSVGSNLTTGIVNIGTAMTSAGRVNIGTSSSQTTLNGTSVNLNNPRMNNPITIGYSIPANSLASLAYIGGLYRANSTFQYDITTNLKAQAPINGIPTGRYCLAMYIYVPATSPAALYETRIGYSASTINPNATTGFTVLNAGILETLTFKPNNTNAMSITCTSYFDVIEGNNNICLLCNSTSNPAGTSVFTLDACRVA